MSGLTRDGTTEPVPRDKILGCERGQGKKHFPCSADHQQDGQPHPVDPYSAEIVDYTYIDTGRTPVGAWRRNHDHEPLTAGDLKEASFALKIKGYTPLFRRQNEAHLEDEKK